MAWLEITIKTTVGNHVVSVSIVGDCIGFNANKHSRRHKAYDHSQAQQKCKTTANKIVFLHIDLSCLDFRSILLMDTVILAHSSTHFHLFFTNYWPQDHLLPFAQIPHFCFVHYA